MKKKLLSLTLGLGLVFAVANVASALGTPADWVNGDAANGMLGGRHNLGAYGIHLSADNSDSNGGTTEVCVFCHTPHHGSTNAPLWNKGNQTDSGSNLVTSTGQITTGRSTSYQAYGTTAGGTSIDTTYCAITYDCLSCHDGVNTFDTLINAPGKGNDGKNNKTATDFNWTFTEDGNTFNDFMQFTRLIIGTDLRDDHPVCEIYEAGKAGLRPTNTVIASISMTLTDTTVNTESDSQTTFSNRWAVSGYIDTSATIGDLLRGPNRNIVECVSCHDPHFSNRSWTEVASTWGGSDDNDGLFLRRVGGNSVSGVCRTCHDK